MRFFWKTALLVVVAATLIFSACGDAYRPVANPIIQPGGDPQQFDAILTLNQNTGSVSGSLSEINVSGDSLNSNRTVGRSPAFVAFDIGRTTMFVANRDSDTVSISAIGNSSVGTISLFGGSAPVFLAGARSGRIYVANSGATAAEGAYPACPSGSIGAIDTTTAVLVNQLCLPAAPSFLLEATGTNRKVFILSSSDNNVRILNIDTGTLSPNVITVGSNPVWATLSLDGSRLFVLNQGSNDISVIDVATEALQPGTISTGGTSPTYMALDPRLNRLYVANTGSDTVAIFDASKSPIVSLHVPVLVGDAPRSIAILPDGSRAYVANTDTNTVSSINSLSFQSTDIPVATAPGATVTWVGASRLGTKVFASVVEPTDLNNGTAAIRTSDQTVVLTIPAPRRDIGSCDPGAPNTTCVTQRQRPMMIAVR